jgi:FKBP-type peptidyl-prolyl cis-trans isomerase SlpA
MPDSPLIAPGAHVTLHYRIAAVIDGAEREVMTTFDARPATLTIGTGELSEPLEARLLGLGAGAREEFELPAGEGYGLRNPQLVQSLARSTFDAHTDPGVEYAPGDVIEFADAAGRRISGVLKERDAERVMIDFNHPLAGRALRFAVHVVGVL